MTQHSFKVFLTERKVSYTNIVEQCDNFDLLNFFYILTIRIGNQGPKKPRNPDFAVNIYGFRYLPNSGLHKSKHHKNKNSSSSEFACPKRFVLLL